MLLEYFGKFTTRYTAFRKYNLAIFTTKHTKKADNIKTQKELLVDREIYLVWQNKPSTAHDATSECRRIKCYQNFWVWFRSWRRLVDLQPPTIVHCQKLTFSFSESAAADITSQSLHLTTKSTKVMKQPRLSFSWSTTKECDLETPTDFLLNVCSSLSFGVDQPANPLLQPNCCCCSLCTLPYPFTAPPQRIFLYFLHPAKNVGLEGTPGHDSLENRVMFS